MLIGMTERQVFCPIPWVHLAIRSNGDFRVCCQANVSDSQGLLREESGRVLNAKADSFASTRNTELMKSIRLSFLQGRYHSACVRCKAEDEAGLPSKRTYTLKNWGQTLSRARAKAMTNDDGSIDADRFKPIYFDIRFGNRCNLRCRMCGPTDSDAWYPEQVKLWGNKFSDAHGEVELVEERPQKFRTLEHDYDWVESDFFWAEIRKHVAYMRHVYSVGGEPLLIPQYYEFLKYCVEENRASNIILELNTNVTAISPRIRRLWPHFSEVRIGASVDGVGKVNDYIRFPSKWPTIEERLRWIQESSGAITSWLAVTVQAYNALHLPEIIKWKLASGYLHSLNNMESPIFAVHVLHNPSYLSVQALPRAFKEKISNRYRAFLANFREIEIPDNSFTREQFFESAKRILDSVERFMFAEDKSEELPKFWHFTKRLDQYRNQSVQNILPDLSEAVENELITVGNKKDSIHNKKFWYYTLKLSDIRGEKPQDAFPQFANEIKTFLRSSQSQTDLP